VRLIAQAVIFNLVQKKLKEEGIIVFSIIFDIISPLIYFVLMISNTLNRSGKNKWK
jgi:hypothetical protein